MSALLVVGFLCNLRVKPLADQFFMKEDDPEHQASMVLLTGIYKVVTVPPQSDEAGYGRLMATGMRPDGVGSLDHVEQAGASILGISCK